MLYSVGLRFFLIFWCQNKQWRISYGNVFASHCWSWF